MSRLTTSFTARKSRLVARANDILRRWEHWLIERPRVAAAVKLIRDVIRTQGETRASLASAGAAFWLTIALFPAVTAAISIFGLVVDQQELNDAFNDLGNERQGSLGAAVSKQVAALTEAPASSLSAGLIISLIFSLWSVSNGSYNLMRAIRLSYGLLPQGYVVARFRGLVAGTVAVFMLGFVAFGSSAANSVNNSLSGWRQLAFTTFVFLPVTTVVLTTLLSLLFRYSVATRTGVRGLLPGALIATFSLVLLATGLGLLLSTFGGDSAVYGVAAGAVSGLIAVYTAIYIIVLAAIVNAHWPTDLTTGLFWSFFGPHRVTHTHLVDVSSQGRAAEQVDEDVK